MSIASAIARFKKPFNDIATASEGEDVLELLTNQLLLLLTDD